MDSRSGGGLGWLQRLWRRSREASEARPGVAGVLPVEAAIGALEGQVCEGVVRRAGDAPSAALASRMELPGVAPRNAFGWPVQEEVRAGAAEAVATATGMALAGLRATTLLDGEELVAAHEALRACARHRAPLVVHAALRDAGHEGLFAVSGSGCFQVIASSGQQALDLTLVARWLAERACVPGLVASDVSAVESLVLPDEETLRAYLGRPDEPLAAPNEFQRILFGRERPRLLPWFDPDRPVATGGARGAADLARARLGEREFFWEPLIELAGQAMEALARLTGRPLAFVEEHRLADADIVLVGQGTAVQCARAAADHLRERRGLRVGVLGIPWLRPFPSEAVLRALAGRRAVVVVESAGASPAEPQPLLRELARAGAAVAGWTSAASAAPGPHPAALASLCERLRDPDHPRRVQLEALAAPLETGFPRRDALLQAVAHAYPGIVAAGVGPGEAAGWTPPRGRSAALLGREAELPPDALARLAERLAPAGGFVRGTATRPEPGAWEARVRAAPADFADPGPQAAVDVLAVVAGDLRELTPGRGAVAPRGTLLVARRAEPERLWAELPAAWRREVRAGELRLLAVTGGFEEALEALGACLFAEESALVVAGRLQELAWRNEPAAPDAERELPHVVSRIQQVRPAHDSLPRFWGEVAQPRQAGVVGELPEPLSAVGVVPALATALEPESRAAALPALDPAACSGCGRCWSACPDSAIGATALGVEALLTAASHAAGTAGPAADALRRGHKHLATRLGTELGGAAAAGAGLDPEQWRQAWGWVAGRLGIAEAERAAYDAAFDATLGPLAALQPVVTAPFFQEPEQEKKGAGELLILAVDPRACLGCGICVAVCPEAALRPEARTPERTAELRRRWAIWETLPDTRGETLARAAGHAEVGPLAAALLSRHCAQALVGGAGGEPGSGERLGARLVAALVESHAQRRLAGLLKTVDERRGELEGRVRELLAEGLSAADLETLGEAVAGLEGRGRGDLAELGERLEALGARATFDRRVVARLTRAAGVLDGFRQRLARGEDGLGRARFGVVAARGHFAQWAARFPRHPFYAPLVVAPTAEGVDLARGIARGLVAEHLALVRSLRAAAVEVQAPADRPARLEAIAALRWEDLDDADRAACTPLLLLGDEGALLERGFEGLGRLLDSELPVKVVLLDGRGRLDPAPEPALVAMAHRRAFVLAASPAHAEPLARGVADALAWPGPAFIHLLAPSPERHGFAPDATLERARLAVEGRAHVLLRYDPSAEGLFGLRASLAGNPGLERDWGELSFAAWAAGEGRFAAHLEPCEAQDGPPLMEWLALPAERRRAQRPTVEVDGRHLALSETLARATAERLAVWNTLREVAGEAGPFAERLRASLAAEFEAERRAEIESLQRESEARLAEARAGADSDALGRLTSRLLELSGFSQGGSPRERNGG